MTGTRESLGRHITPKLDDARLARQRDAINTRLDAHRRRRLPLLLTLVMGIIVAAFVLFRFRGGSEERLGTVVEAPASERLPMTLPDGSRILLDPSSRLIMKSLLPKDIRLEL